MIEFIFYGDSDSSIFTRKAESFVSIAVSFVTKLNKPSGRIISMVELFSRRFDALFPPAKPKPFALLAFSCVTKHRVKYVNN